MLKLRLQLFIFGGFIASALFANSSPGYEYLYPPPGAQHVSKFTRIIIRLENGSAQAVKNITNCIQVMDDQGNEYRGSTHLASDFKTVTFKPANPFKPGSIITVAIRPDLPVQVGAQVEPVEYNFSVSTYESIPKDEDKPEFSSAAPLRAAITTPIYNPSASTELTLKKAAADNGVSVPSDFPFVDVRYSDNPDTGYIFMNNWGNEPPYNIIFDNSGNPIWYHKYPDRRRDFKVQKNGLITMLVRTGYPFGEGFIAMDNTYTVVDSFHAVDGYGSDEHGMQLLEDGGYLLMGRRETQVDMSQYVEGGRKNATVRENVIQEFSPNHELLFQWRAWDHFDIRDCYVPGENELTGGYIRFPHMNAIDIDDDGNILLSSRHLSEVTKINRQTGEIIWRLGGEKNQFTFIDDPLNGPENQHDVRALGNNHYTVFDNGNEHDPQVSRAVEYEVDTDNMTATLVWQFRDTPDKYTHWMGNHQRLPNGNRLINWADGSLPKITEVRENGELAFELWWKNYTHTYRVFRFPWQGKAKIPYLVLEPHKEAVHLIFNKFGDPDVDYYNIYAGTSQHPSKVLDTCRTTFKSLTNLQDERQYYFRVTAVSKSGQESEFSNEESALVNFVEPGQNMVINGDFSQKKRGWFFWAGDGASANWVIEDGVTHIKISNGSDAEYKVQLVQLQMELLKDENYILEYDAWADEARPLICAVLQNGQPYTNYSQTGTELLLPQKKHYAFPFKMINSSDFNAILVFLFGGASADVYLDNVELKRVVDTNVDRSSGNVLTDYRLISSYPNPFNSSTTIAFSIPERSNVTLELFNLLGQFEKRIEQRTFDPGLHSVLLNAHDLGSGMYFCRMTANNGRFRSTLKLAVIK